METVWLNRVNRYYEKLSVVPYTNKRLQQTMMCVVLLGYVLIAWAGYWGGYSRSRTQMSLSETRITALHEKKVELKGVLDEAQARVAKQQQEMMLDRRTIELLRQENIELESKIAELEQELTFYQRVVKTTGDTRGLAFGRFSVEHKWDNHFDLTLDLMQISGRVKVSGKLYLSIEGVKPEQGREQIVLPAHVVVPELNEKSLPLKFTHFQSIALSVVLPKGFEPRAVVVKAAFNRGKKVTLEQRFDWVTKE
jgi:hypothetical protein